MSMPVLPPAFELPPELKLLGRGTLFFHFEIPPKLTSTFFLLSGCPYEAKGIHWVMEVKPHYSNLNLDSII